MEDNIKPYSAEELNTRLDRVNSWIDNCDQKASILLAFAGALAAVLLTSELWESIRHHREIYTSVNGMDYTPDVRERLVLVPRKDIMNAWKSDYEQMMSAMIYGEKPSWDELMVAMKELQERVRNSVR